MLELVKPITQMNIEQYIFPIYSGKTIIGQGFVADGYFITAAHVVKDFPACFVNINGGKFELTKENPIYIGEGDIYHDANMVDVAIYSCRDIDSPFFFSECSPQIGEELNSYCIHEATCFGAPNPSCELRIMPTTSNGEEGNYFYCNCGQYAGCSGSPLLKGNELVGVMHGGNGNGWCVCLKGEIIKKIIFKIEQETLTTEVTDEDLKNAWVDEDGVMYSMDKKRLLKMPHSKKEYSINRKTRVICDAAFANAVRLKSINIPDCVIVIGRAAFRNCLSLCSIVIPNNVKEICDEAFENCKNLTSVKVPNGLKTIGHASFRECYNLTTINIPVGLIYIDEAAFSGCSELSSAIIPRGMKFIGHSTFKGCSSLTSIRIPEGVTAIGEDAFCDCYRLTSVVISESVENIGDGAFSGCYSLKSLIISNNVTSIERGAFSGCSGLQSLFIPKSVAYIGRGAFSGCSGLESIIVDGNNKCYDSRGGCNAIIETSTNRLISGCKTTVIPNSVKWIGASAFDGCTGLTSIIIHDNIRIIDECAFKNCI